MKEKVGAAVEELRALLPIDGRSSRAPTALEFFANLVFGFAIGHRALVGMWLRYWATCVSWNVASLLGNVR